MVMLLLFPCCGWHWAKFPCKQLWMTQSAGGPHSSFQPIIQMESAIQAASLQISFVYSLSRTSLHCELSVRFISYFTWQPDCYLLSWQHEEWHEKEWAQLLSQNNRKSHKASSMRCSGCYCGGNDGQRRVYQWGILFSEQSIQGLHRDEKVPVFVTLRGKCPWQCVSLITDLTRCCSSHNRGWITEQE